MQSFWLMLEQALRTHDSQPSGGICVRSLGFRDRHIKVVDSLSHSPISNQQGNGQRLDELTTLEPRGTAPHTLFDFGVSVARRVQLARLDAANAHPRESTDLDIIGANAFGERS